VRISHGREAEGEGGRRERRRDGTNPPLSTLLLVLAASSVLITQACIRPHLHHCLSAQTLKTAACPLLRLHAVRAVRRVYHSVEAPSYQLGDIRSPPLAVFYGGRDRLADSADVATLLAALPPGAVVYSQVCLYWCWKCVLQAGVLRHAGCGMRLPLRLVGLAGAVCWRKSSVRRLWALQLWAVLVDG
jgi:hypothetical protein